ncbi:hypothetical protein ScPMuIL_007419 [Solemya velum]
MVNKLLRQWDDVGAYLDDVMITSDQWNAHLQRLRDVFQKFLDANLTLNLAKCEFGSARVECLGHVVGLGKVLPTQAKIDGILKYPQPTNRREVRRILGSTGFYRRFCPNYSTVAAPLTDLLKEDRKFKWTPECEKAFHLLKHLLCSSPVVASPNFARAFKLAIDSSNTGTGAVLFQEDESGFDHPVSYFFQKIQQAPTKLFDSGEGGFRDYSKWQTKDYPKDVVLLRQTDRGPFAPSLSPFPIKLETYLRIAKIPYKIIHSLNMGPKNKIPWIEYNGEVVTDSEFCIKFLSDRLGVDLNKHLTSEQKATARLLQRMIDEHLYWTSTIHRWVLDRECKTLQLAGVPKIITWYMGRRIDKVCHGQGIGRHSHEELEHISKTDFKALSDFLGTKNFMMGDELSEVDCAAFGQLAQVRWQLHGSPGERFLLEHKNLVEYLDRIKDAVWPDWEECTTKGGTVKATA